MELLLTGRWMDAAEAHRWGLVNEVLTFVDGLVVHGRGTYLAAAATTQVSSH